MHVTKLTKKCRLWAYTTQQTLVFKPGTTQWLCEMQGSDFTSPALSRCMKNPGVEGVGGIYKRAQNIATPSIPSVCMVCCTCTLIQTSVHRQCLNCMFLPFSPTRKEFYAARQSSGRSRKNALTERAVEMQEKNGTLKKFMVLKTCSARESMKYLSEDPS